MWGVGKSPALHFKAEPELKSKKINFMKNWRRVFFICRKYLLGSRMLLYLLAFICPSFHIILEPHKWGGQASLGPWCQSHGAQAHICREGRRQSCWAEGAWGPHRQEKSRASFFGEVTFHLDLDLTRMSRESKEHSRTRGQHQQGQGNHLTWDQSTVSEAWQSESFPVSSRLKGETSYLRLCGVTSTKSSLYLQNRMFMFFVFFVTHLSFEE